MQTISPQEAQAKLQAGALLVDICSPDEHKREHIQNALNLPLDSLATADKTPLKDAKTLIFHCLSGVRTQNAASQLEALLGENQEGFKLEGGLKAWKDAGLATQFDAKQPLPLMRQVQIAAGSLVLIGTLLGFVNKWFLLLSAFVGCGLIFAGITGFCGMALLLAKMPWNKVSS